VGRTFHVSSLAQVAAIAALADEAHLRASASHARRCIERFRAEVRAPTGRVLPSLTNFVLIECGRPSAPIYDALLRKGVIVRPMAAWGLPDAIRVSVTRDEDMPRVITALNEVLAS
jgi:histidinol-phosphate aminotransferase